LTLCEVVYTYINCTAILDAGHVRLPNTHVCRTSESTSSIKWIIDSSSVIIIKQKYDDTLKGEEQFLILILIESLKNQNKNITNI